MPDDIHETEQLAASGPEGFAPDRVQALLGMACALTVAAGLGFPGLDAGACLQVLLALVGFRVARVVHRFNTDTEWRVPLVLGLAGRAVPTVLLVVGLIAVYRIATGGLAGGETAALIGAATFTSSIVPFVTDAAFGAVDHLWAVALVAHTVIVAPWLLTAGRSRLCPRRRAMLLFGGAGALMAARMVAVATSTSLSDRISDTGAWLTPPDASLLGLAAVWTSLDALLIGLAIGTLPLAALHRHPTTRLVVPAVAGLALLLVTPPITLPPIVDVGLRLPLAAALTGVVLASEAISGLPRRLNRALTSTWWHRLGSRSFGLYLWHLPFGYALSDGRPYDWQGPGVFIVTIALTLAAATTTYRSIEIPSQAVLARFVSRWYEPDTVLLPTHQPQRGKWVRWDDISLENLPIPTRRRSRRSSGRSTGSTGSTGSGDPVGHRLWQVGDRSIDLRPGRRRGAGGSTATSGPATVEPSHEDRSAATG